MYISHGSNSGRVTALMTKPRRRGPMLLHASAVACKGQGLIGDCHAQPLGPRQVLLVRQEDLDRHALAIWQVRANIAVAGLRAEDLESGRVVRLGAEALIRVTHVCEVCKVLRGYVPEGVLSQLVGQRGSLGVILRGGQISLQDAVTSRPSHFPEVPDGIYDRLAWVLARVPSGRVVTYATLITLVGASRPYFRVLPTYLRRAAAAGLPAHRVLTTDAALTGHIESQGDALRREGVAINPDGQLADRNRLWEGREIYVVAS